MEELVIKAKSGDKVSFERLIIEIQNDLYRIAQIRLKNDEDADDAIQNTIIKVYKTISRLNSPQYFKTWVIRILINECNNIIRKNKREKRIEEKFKSKANNVLDSETNIETLIEHLPKTEQIILNLYYKDGYSYREIGYILRMNSNTVKSKMFRAKEKLKKDYYKERVVM